MSFYCPRFVTAIINDKQKRIRYHKQYGIRYCGPGPWRTACRLLVAGCALTAVLTAAGFCLWSVPTILDGAFGLYVRTTTSVANALNPPPGNVGLDRERLRKEMTPEPK